MKTSMPFRTCARHSEIKSRLSAAAGPLRPRPTSAPMPPRANPAPSSCCSPRPSARTARSDRCSPSSRSPRRPLVARPAPPPQLRHRTPPAPLLGAQIFAVGLSLIAAVVFLAWQSKQGLAWLTDFPRSLHLEAFHFEALVPAEFQSPLGLTALIVAVLALIAVLSGAVAYSTSEKR